MKKLTGNQIVANFILGHIPKGFVMCVEWCNNPANYRIGVIYIDGVQVASIPASLNNNTLPSSKELGALS